MKRYVQMMTDNLRGSNSDQDQNSSIRMGTVWKTDEPGTDTWQGVKSVCSHRLQTGHGIQYFGAVGTGLHHLRDKRPECEFQTKADFKNTWSCTSSPPYLTVSCSVKHGGKFYSILLLLLLLLLWDE
jgi:hypothetical protein